MSFQEKLCNAFENVAPYITNLDVISSLIQQLVNEVKSLRAFMSVLEEKMIDADVTLRTDIQILFDEIQHILRLEERKSVT
jgi:hypothetical protein